MKRFLITLTLAALMIAFTAELAPALAGDPFEKEAQCQACTDNADEFWRKCVNTVGDEGDAQCRALADDYLAECQREYCID